MAAEERPARIKLEAPADQLVSDLRVARDKLRKFASGTRQYFGGSKRESTGGEKLLRGARVGVGALEAAGSSLFSSISGGLGEVQDFERSMTRFQISGNVGARAMLELRNELGRVSGATGVARTELLSGAASYLALTGDAAGAAKSIDLFAKVANASGASMADVANTAASLRENLKIDPKDFEAGFSALIVQGKAGAIELKDLAQELASVAPSFAQFEGGTGAAGLATLGAALQAGRKGFSSASEAATGLRNLMISINRNAEKFSSAGVRVYDRDAKTGKKTLKGFREIVDGIANSRLAKDPTLLTKAFGSDEAKRFYDQLVLNRDLMNDLETKSRDGGAVAADALIYQQSAAGKLEQAMEKLKMSIASAFTPERIQQFASALERIASAAGKFAEAFNAVFEFGEVRAMKNRNEEQLVAMGEYTGDDREMRRDSMINAKRIAMQDEVFREKNRPLLVQKVLEAAGPGALTLQQQSIAPPSIVPTSKPSQSQSRSAPAPAGTLVIQLDGNTLAKSVLSANQSRRTLGGR
ncbi:MAG: phage tail tape measure protein [Bosea sp. (in: a-proteobacteria)]